MNAQRQQVIPTNFSFTPVPSGLLQCKCACGNHILAGGECVECRKNQSLQRVRHSSQERGTEGEREIPPIVHEVLRLPGQPLDPATRAFFEPQFGHDFSKVRVHTDGKAAESARAVNALAYTVERDVVFGAGQYMPMTKTGQGLLAHELTHVLQQRNIVAGSPQGLDIATARGSASEIEAERASLAVFSGSSVPEVSRPSANVGRMVMLQRQEVCEPQGGTPSLSTADVIYDYENQACRPPDPDEVSASVPESDLVDGEFWIWPSGLREGAKPIFDDEDTSVIVGFRYYSGGYYEIYDLEGSMVESGEPGLEAPLIDPIDILAGGITGLGRGLLRGGGRAVARGVAGGAGRGGGAALARAGLVVTIKALSRRAITGIRGVYRAIRFRGALNFTGTTIARMADPARRVPHHVLKLTIRFGTRSPDPQGVAGAFRYVIPMIRNGRQYTLEVVIREADMTVLHFLYR